LDVMIGSVAQLSARVQRSAGCEGARRELCMKYQIAARLGIGGLLGARGRGEQHEEERKPPKKAERSHMPKNTPSRRWKGGMSGARPARGFAPTGVVAAGIVAAAIVAPGVAAAAPAAVRETP